MANKESSNGLLGKKKFLTLKRRESLNGYLFLLPWLIGTAALFIYPIIYSFRLSFSTIISATENIFEFTGPQLYVKAVTGDARYLSHYITNISTMMQTVPFVNVFSLIIAVMLNRKFKGRALFRAIFFLPVILGAGFAMSQLMSQGVNQEAMETVKEMIIPREVAIYIGAEATKLISGFLDLVSTILWKSGVPIIIYLAALQGVPTSLYEAARVDAAGEWESFWLITLPMISPNILLNLVYTVIDSFNASGNVLLMYINEVSFGKNPDFPYASAMSWLFFLWIIVLIAVIFLVMRPFTNKVKD